MTADLRQLARTYIPRGAVTPHETFEPIGFGPGDTAGNEQRAIVEAQRERALTEPGSPRDQLFALQESIGRGLTEGALAPCEFRLQHLFPPGLYLRTIFLPAGSVLVGKIHKHRHGNILSTGHVRVFTEHGGTEDFHGPRQMISEPGTKRAVLSIKDAVWTTIHLNPDNTQDLAVLEDRIIASTYEDYDAYVKGQA